jgi:anti-sigma-K factor RskA
MTPGSDFEHGEWDALAVGWAMSALDPEDEAIFLPHLATCRRCADTVAETTRTVGDMAWTVPEEAPSPELRDRLMSAVRAEPRGVRPLPNLPPPAEPPLPGTGGIGPVRPASPPAGPPPAGSPWGGEAPGGYSGPGTGPGGPPPGPRSGGGSGGGRSGPRHAAEPAGTGDVVPLRRTPRWRPLAAAAAAVAVIAGLGGWNLQLRGDRDELRRAATGPARVAELDSPSGQPAATVLVRGDTVDVVTAAVPPNDAGSTYWLWGMTSPTDAHPVPIAGFAIATAQVSVHTVGSGGKDLGGLGYFAVSREPAGRTPTTPTTLVTKPGQAR